MKGKQRCRKQQSGAEAQRWAGGRACTGWVRLAGVTVWFTMAPAGPWAPENTCKSLDAANKKEQTVSGVLRGEAEHHLWEEEASRPVAGVLTSTDAACSTEGSCTAAAPAVADDEITTLSTGTSCWELN